MSMSYGDKTVTTLRALVAVIDRDLASAAPSAELRVAWAQMVETLALGPAPELRSCPICGEIGMRAATRCIRCWTTLPALAPADAQTAG